MGNVQGVGYGFRVGSGFKSRRAGRGFTYPTFWLVPLRHGLDLQVCSVYG